MIPEIKEGNMGQKEYSKASDEMLDCAKEFERFWEHDPQYTPGDSIDRDVMKRRCSYVWRMAFNRVSKSKDQEIETLKTKLKAFQYGTEAEI